MVKVISFLKFIFHVSILLLIIISLFPGSLLGFIIYKDISKQPQISPDLFILSSNHVYAFFVLSILGLLAYFKSLKIIILYLILISIILELSHLLIPNRSFQFSDLFGNIAGVLISIFILILFNFWRKR